MSSRYIVIISSNAEWKVLKTSFPNVSCQESPYGEYFFADGFIYLHGGWGKVDAAASAQFAISKWDPNLVFNIGTCGGIAGKITAETIVLANGTAIYDIREQMYDPEEAIKEYQTEIDLSWLGEPKHPILVERCKIFSADRDLAIEDLDLLHSLGARVVDWESGSIARVCHKNRVGCLILRGVSDLVSQKHGSYEANQNSFETNIPKIFDVIIPSLPRWVEIWDNYNQLQGNKNG